MRLLVLTSTYPASADDPGPRFVHDLCRHLTNRFEVHVLTPHRSLALFEETLDGVNVHRFRYAPDALEGLTGSGGILGNLWGNPWKLALVPLMLFAFLWSSWALIRRVRPHVIHAHWYVPAGIIAAISKGGVPLVVTSHGSDVFRLNGKIATALRRWVSRRAATVTVVGQALAEHLYVERVSGVDVIPMGVDLSGHFFEGDREKVSTNRLLFAGRLMALKRPQEVIRALHELAKTGFSFDLDVAGDGPDREALEAEVVRLGLWQRVRFHGALQQTDLADLYRKATLTVVASGDVHSPEGLGLIALEAISCGCPVVSVPNPSLSSFLPGNPLLCFAESSSPMDLSAAIRSAIDNAGKITAVQRAAAREQLENVFSWNHVSNLFADRLQAAALYSRSDGRADERY